MARTIIRVFCRTNSWHSTPSVLWVNSLELKVHRIGTLVRHRCCGRIDLLKKKFPIILDEMTYFHHNRRGFLKTIPFPRKMCLLISKKILFLAFHSLEKSYRLLGKDSSQTSKSYYPIFFFTTFWYATIRSWQMKPFEKRTTYHLSTKFQATAWKRLPPQLSEMTLKVDTSRLHLQRRKNAEFNTLNETAATPLLA